MKSDEFPEVRVTGDAYFSASVGGFGEVTVSCSHGYREDGRNKWDVYAALRDGHTLYFLEGGTREQARQVLDGLYAAAAALVANRNIAEWSTGISIEHREPQADRPEAEHKEVVDIKKLREETVAWAKDAVEGFVSPKGGA